MSIRPFVLLVFLSVLASDTFAQKYSYEFWEAAEKAAAKHDYKSAIEMVTKAIELDTLDKQVYSFRYPKRAGLRYFTQDLEGALADLNRALAIDPEAIYVLRYRGIVLESLGRIDEAVADYQKSDANAEVPSNDIKTRIAEARLKTGGGAAAQSETANWLMFQANFFQVVGDHSRSVETYTKAINLEPSNAYIYRGRSGAKSAAGDKSGALDDANKAISLDPTSPWGYISRASIKFGQGDKAGYIADASKAIELAPHLALLYAYRASYHEVDKNFNLALADIDKAISIKPTYSYYDVRARLREPLGDPIGAIDDLTRSSELRPSGRISNQAKIDQIKKEKLTDLKTAYLNRCISYQQNKEFDRAVATCTTAIDQFPNNSEALAIRADAYRSLKKFDLAAADVGRSLQIQPNETIALMVRSMIYADNGRYDEAIADLNRVVKDSPENMNGYFWRAKAFFRKGVFTNAAKDIDEALKLGVTEPEAFFICGVSNARTNNPDHALIDLEKYVSLMPNDAFGYSERGSAYSSKGQYQKALDDYTKARSLDASMKLNGLRAVALTGLDRHDEALKEINIYIAEDTNDAFGYSIRALINRRKGDYDATVADYQKMRSLDKTQTRMPINLAYVYLFANKPDLAAQQASNYLELNGLKAKDDAAYAVITAYLGMRKSNKAADATAFIDEWLPQLEEGEWSTSLVGHLKGTVPAGTLIGSADNNGKLTEAHFYIGEMQLINGQIDKAKLHFDWVMENGEKTFDEYDFAKAELKRLAAGPAPKFTAIAGAKPATTAKPAGQTAVGTKKPASPMPKKPTGGVTEDEDYPVETPSKPTAKRPATSVPDKSKPNDPDVGSGPYPPGTDFFNVRVAGVNKCTAGEFRSGIAIQDRLIRYAKTESDFYYFSEPYASRGYCKERMGDYAGAFADYSTAIRMSPEIGIYYKWRGQVNNRLGKKAAALADSQKCSEVDVEQDCSVEPEPEVSMTTSSEPGPVATRPVERVVDRSKPRDPDVGSGPFPAGTDLDAVFAKVVEKCQADEFKSGLAIADRLIRFAVIDPAKNEPWNYHAWFAYKGRGHCNEMKKDYAAAYADFNTAIKMEPTNAMLYALRGEMLFMLGRKAEGRADQKKCVDMGGYDGCTWGIDEQ